MRNQNFQFFFAACFHDFDLMAFFLAHAQHLTIVRERQHSNGNQSHTHGQHTLTHLLAQFLSFWFLV